MKPGMDGHPFPVAGARGGGGAQSHPAKSILIATGNVWGCVDYAAGAGDLFAVTAVTIKDAMNMTYAATAISGHGAVFFLPVFLVAAMNVSSDHPCHCHGNS